MANKPKAKRTKASSLGQLEKLPKSKPVKVSSVSKVSYVLRKDHAKPTKLA